MRKIFSTIIAVLAAICGLTAFGDTDENGLTPTHWYKFDGNLTSFGSSSLTFGGEKGDSYTPSDNNGQAYLFKSGYHPWGDSGMSRGSGDFTVTAVARTANLDHGIIWSMGTKGQTRSLNLVAINANQVALRISGSDWSSTGEDVITATVNDATALYHVYTLTYTESTKTFALYVDTNTTAAGTKVMTDDVGANFTAANFQFGSMNQGVGYGMTQGYGIALDDFRLYQQLLTSDQIAKICETFPAKTVFATTSSPVYGTTCGAALAAEGKTITVKGSGSYGATISNETTTAMTSHFVFDQGTQTFVLNSKGASANYQITNYGTTDNDPMITVNDDTTLNFIGRDVGGWNSARQAKAVVAVGEDATLNMTPIGGTFYFPGTIKLSDGANVTLASSDVRFVGGDSADAFVMEDDGSNETAATISGAAFVAQVESKGTPGVPINVGSYATLTISAPLQGAATVTKKGAGTLKLTGAPASYTGAFVVNEGTLELDLGEGNVISPSSISVNGEGTVIVKSGTLNLGTTRTAKGIDFEAGAAVLAEATAAEVTAGTISVDYLPESIESITIVTPDNRVFTAQRDDKGVATVTLTAATAVQGSNCLLDYTFNKETLYKRLATTSIVSTGSDTGALGYDTGYSASNSYNTDNGALLVKSTPYKTQTWPDNYTVAVYANVPDAEKCCLMAFGTKTEGYIAIVRGSSANEILLVKGTGDVACDTVATMAADNATVAKHLVVFTKDGTTYKVYCDGVKVAEKTIESFTLGSGFQIGSIHGGVGTKTGISRVSALTGEAKDAVEVGAIRVFNKVLTSDEMSLLTAEFPYASKGGHFTRTISGDANLSETGAWAKDDDTETYALPDGTAEAGITYKPSATITTTADATLTLNESLSLDRLTLDGSSKLTIVANEGKTLDTTGAVIVNGTLQFKYVDVDIHASPLQLGTNGKVIIDLTGMDTKPLMVEKTTLAVQLTGTTDETTDGVTVINKPTLLGRTLDLVFDNGNYWLKVTPDHTAGANLYFQSGYWSTTKDTFKVALTKGGSATAFLSGDTIVFDKDYTAEGQGDGVYLDSTAVGTTIGVNSDFYFHTGADATILSNKVITIAAGKTLTINKAYNHAIDLGPVTFNGGTVKLGDGVTVSGAITGTSTIQIDAGSTVTINAGGSIANTIDGAGTLAIKRATKVTLAEGWKGNVTLSGTGFGGSAYPLSGYVNANSTLTLNGWKGWLASETIAEITVTDPDEETYGMNVSDGSSYDSWNYVFTKVKGTGTIATTKEGGASFQPILIRDVSEFTGKFVVTEQSILVTDQDIDYSTTYAQQFFVDADKTVAVESVTAPKVVVNGTLKVKTALTETPTTTTTGNAVFTTTEGDYTVYTSESVGATIGDVSYKTFEAALAVAKSGQTVTLAKNATLTAAQTIAGGVTLDLGGNAIDTELATGYLFEVTEGEVTVTGGTITSTTGVSGFHVLGATLALEGMTVSTVGRTIGAYNAATVTVDAETTLTTSGEDCTIMVYGDNTKPRDDASLRCTVTIAGKVYQTYGTVVNSGYEAVISGNGLDVAAGMTLTIEDGAVIEGTACAGIYFPCAGTLTIGAATIKGTEGVYVKGGASTVVDGATITATGTASDYVGNSSGHTWTGDAFVVDVCKAYKAGVQTQSITGGTFTSANGYAVATYAQSTATEALVTGFVSGGTFSGAKGCANTTDVLAAGKTFGDNGTVRDFAAVPFTVTPGTGSTATKFVINGTEVETAPTTITEDYTWEVTFTAIQDYEFEGGLTTTTVSGTVAVGATEVEVKGPNATKVEGPQPQEESGTTVEKTDDNTYTLTPGEGKTTVAVTGVKSGDTLVVGATVTSIGVNSADGVTIRVMNSGNTTDISAYVKGWNGTTFDCALDATKAATTIAADDGDETETDPAAGTIVTTAKPGLTYTLKRAEKVGEVKTGAKADAKTAGDTDTTVTLTDKIDGEKPATAFYIIEVTK